MSHDDFQPPDVEEDRDAMWDQWFTQQETNGMVIATREELQERLDRECTDAYAEGRRDERQEILDVLKRSGFELRTAPNGYEFLLNVQDDRDPNVMPWNETF